MSIFVHTFCSTHIKWHRRIVCFTHLTMVTFDPIVTQTFAVILVTICAICTKLITVATCKGKLGKITHKLQILSCKYKAIGICDKNKKKWNLDHTGTSWRVVTASLRVQAPVARLTFVTLLTTHPGETVTRLGFGITGHLPGASPVAATIHCQ